MAFPILGANTASGAFEIENSVRYNQVDLPKLSWAPGSDADRQTMTWSFWVKRHVLINDTEGSYQFVCSLDDENVGFNPVIRFNNDAPGDGIRFSWISGGNITTNRAFRDVTAWYHIVIALDTTQGTGADRINIYVNGVQETSFASANYGSQNDTSNWGKSGRSFDIGYMDNSSEAAQARHLDGSLAHFYYINGQQLTPSSFGEVDEDSGIWKPIKYSGSYNSYSWFLEFKETGTSANASGIGADTSGNGNHFTPTNLTSLDISTDSPTNNFCTLNNVWTYGHLFSEGALGVIGTASSGYRNTCATWEVPQNGKWYWECEIDAHSGSQHSWWGIKQTRKNFGLLSSNTEGYDLQSQTCQWYQYSNGSDGGFGDEGTDAAQDSGLRWAAGDILQCAVDLPNQKLWFGRGGTWYDNDGTTDGDPANGTNPTCEPTRTHFSNTIRWEIFCGAGGNYTKWLWNFGNPPFTISSGNSDANGYGNFEYAVPTGFYSLCTKNLAQYGG